MPENIKKAFFEYMYGTANDCYVSWYNDIYDENKEDENEDEEFLLRIKKNKIVNDWLLQNGMEETDNEVLINHWW